MKSLSVTLFLNKPELISTQLNGFKYCYLIFKYLRNGFKYCYSILVILFIKYSYLIWY